MGTVRASASKPIHAAPEQVLAFLRDYRGARPKILTDNYTAYRVERGGEGAGTVLAYHFAAGGRERDYRLDVQESNGTLYERDQLSSFVATWSVAPGADGSVVTIEATWDGASGIGGFFEGLFAPLGLRRIFGEMLDRLAAAVQRRPQ
ncbi:MAG TPA: SRPBCC family protein [Solirubrobacteraceae bacterium]